MQCDQAQWLKLLPAIVLTKQAVNIDTISMWELMHSSVQYNSEKENVQYSLQKLILLTL